MLDRFSLKIIKKPLQLIARIIVQLGVSANQISVTGFFVGLLTIPALAIEQYSLALGFILINRVMDGIDGEVARATQTTDKGAFLDIVLDFIFYAGVIFGFALAEPSTNALAAAGLIFGFMGTGASFLAFAIFAERKDISSIHYPNKGFYYLSGITEGTETIGFFTLMCLLPQYFPIIAWVFFGLCLITTITRVVGGAHTLKS